MAVYARDSSIRAPMAMIAVPTITSAGTFRIFNGRLVDFRSFMSGLGYEKTASSPTRVKGEELILLTDCSEART